MHGHYFLEEAFMETHIETTDIPGPSPASAPKPNGPAPTAPAPAEPVDPDKPAQYS